MSEDKRLTAYNTKTKQKGVPMFNAKISKNVSGNRTNYVAQGTTEDGSAKLSSILSATKAEEAINAGVAARGKGWD